jgi:hypothetical protein
MKLKMPLPVLLIFVLVISACRQSSSSKKETNLKETNQYSIVLHLKIKRPDNSFKNSDQTITVSSENDSMAYWQGVKRYAGILKTGKDLKAKGTIPPFLIDSFTVYNSNKENILASLPPNIFNQSAAYVRKVVDGDN